MNPSSDQITSIRSFVSNLAGQWTNTDAQIRAAMAATHIANPISQPTVPKPFVAADLATACSAPNRPNLAGYLVGAAELIIAQDSPHLSAGLDAMVIIGAISSADATAMKAAMTQTQPDPSWTAQVAWDVGTFGRVADDFDIEQARHS